MTCVEHLSSMHLWCESVVLHTSRMSGLTPNQWEKARKAIEILSKIPVCVAGESSRAGEFD